MSTPKFRIFNTDESLDVDGKPSMKYDYRPEINDTESDNVMMSTLTKDKNGKEIYEGDVVVVHHPKYADKVAFIDFTNGTFLLDFPKSCSYVPLWNLQSSEYDNAIEVIGNGYENKELLK